MGENSRVIIHDSRYRPPSRKKDGVFRQRQRESVITIGDNYCNSLQSRVSLAVPSRSIIISPTMGQASWLQVYVLHVASTYVM